MVTIRNKKNNKRSWDINKDSKVVISSADNTTTTYECRYCNLPMVRLDDISYYCNKCMSEQFPDKEDNKRKSKLIAPNQNQNTETLVSMTPSGYENIKSTKRVEPRGAFVELQRRGLRITDYNETNP
jgi:hypothetical protein